MARALLTDKADGAKKIDVGYELPAARALDNLLKQVLATLETLPVMISAAVKAPVVNVPAPVVNVETPKAEVKVTHPTIHVSPAEIKIPPPAPIKLPEQKAPVVQVEAPEVHIETQRPRKWRFTIHRNDYGQITVVDAEAVEKR